VRRILRLSMVVAASLLIGWVLTTMDLGSRPPIFRTVGVLASDAEAGEKPSWPLAKLRLLTRSIGFIRTHYVVPARVRPKAMLIGALRGAEAAVPDLLVTPDSEDEDRVRQVQIRIGDRVKTFEIGEIRDLYEMNWRLLDCFEFIAPNLPPDVKPEDVEYAAINGLLTPLDEHSNFLPPQAYKEMQLDTQGRFGGLGIVISARKGLITVVSVMPETPAARAGLRSGDQIMQINEESAINMPLSDAVSRLRGEPGTRVRILVQRKEWSDPKSLTLERAEIHVRSVTSEKLGDGVGYVRIRNFQEDTAEQLRDHLKRLRAAGSLKGLVLDLRQNPGGLLEVAVDVANLFVAKGTLVVTEGQGHRMRQEYEADGTAPHARLPMVVLVDEGSASAAEIVAGALKNDDRALLLGTRTFGKGTVQVLFDVGDGALKLTVAQYLTPGDISIQGVGVAPDIELIPARTSGDYVTLGTGDERMQRDPKRKLEAFGKVADDRPERRLRYLSTDDQQERGADDEEEPPLRDDETFRRDEVIDLAQRVTLAMSVASRRRGLAEVEAPMEAWSRSEDQRLVEALAARGIDWTAGPAGDGSALDLRWSLEAPQPLVPDRKVTMKMTARNNGARSLSRVRVVTESDFEPLDGREFLFGRLRPGEAVTREIQVRIPADSWERQDRVDFRLFQGEEELTRPPSATVAVASLPRPLFAWDVQVLDDQGNGNGVLEPGESATLLVDLLNVGEGAARKVLVTARNKEGQAGLQVRNGRATLSQGLKQKQYQQVRLQVEWPSAQQEIQPSLEVSVMDLALREVASEDVVFPVSTTRVPAFEPRRGSLKTGSGGATLRRAALESAAPLFHLPSDFRLRALGRQGEWWRVEVEEGRVGFVKDSEVTWDGQDATRFSTLPMMPELGYVPPMLDVRVEPVAAADGKCGSVRIQGTVRFPGREGDARRKILVFRGNAKVHFWTRQGPTTEATVPLDATVPLVQGRNDFMVVAVEGKDRTTIRRFSRWQPESPSCVAVGTTARGEP